MGFPILTVAIRQEMDTVTVRQRCRHVARLLGFDTHAGSDANCHRSI